jgi:acyl-CoA thioesterase
VSTDVRPSAPAAFDSGTAVEAAGPSRWRGHIEDGWDIGGVPNGGYVMSIAVSAILAELDVPDPVTLTGHYLAPATAGPVEIDVEHLRAGRRHSTAVAAMRQGEREVLRVLATCTDLGQTDGPSHVTLQPPDLPPLAACVRPEPNDTFTPPPITNRVHLALHPDHVGFAVGAPPGVAEMAAWQRFADGREPDTRSLPLFADALPPAVFNLGVPPAWVPTVELTVHVRARPAAGWLRAVCRTEAMAGGYLSEDGELWDSAGRLVAQTRQLALVPRA